MAHTSTTCVICGAPAERSPSGTTYGNNPDPFPCGEDDVCCNSCNTLIVLPWRNAEYTDARA